MVCVLTCFSLATQTIWQSSYVTNALAFTKGDEQQDLSSTSNGSLAALFTRSHDNNNNSSSTSNLSIRTASSTTTKIKRPPLQHDADAAFSDAAVTNRRIPTPPRVVQWLVGEAMRENNDAAIKVQRNNATTTSTSTSNSVLLELPATTRKLDYPMSSQQLQELNEPESDVNNITATHPPVSEIPTMPVREFERPFYDDCEPVLNKVHVHPTCNGIHELDFATDTHSVSLLSMAGSWRSVWKVLQEPNKDDDDNNFNTSSISSSTSSSSSSAWRNEQSPPLPPLILKVLNLERPFGTESFAIHAVDSIVMDRLTASPHVVSSFGFCGCSTVTEFATQSGRDTIKQETLTFRTRLRLARDLARGLAELHASVPLKWGDGSGSALSSSDAPIRARATHLPLPVLFAHHDINSANIVQIDREPIANTTTSRTTPSIDVDEYDDDAKKKKKKKESLQEQDQENIQIQWNDFNLGIWLRQPKSSNTTASYSSTAATLTTRGTWNHCLAPVRYEGPLWRSPEEISNTSTVQADQCDVYSFGNILFQMLTKRQPWTHLEENPKKPPLDLIAKAKKVGQFPRLPTKYYNDTSTRGSNKGRLEKLVLYEAIQASYRMDPLQRPTAYELANALGMAYDWLSIGRAYDQNAGLTPNNQRENVDGDASRDARSAARTSEELHRHSQKLMTPSDIRQMFEKRPLSDRPG
jgi:serine/threonine protein kinase